MLISLAIGTSPITESVFDLILKLNNMLVNIVLEVNNKNSSRLYILIG